VAFLPNKVKKWLMLQMWRLQQVAQPLTLAMLSVTISLQVWGFVKWRNEILANPLFGVLVILVPLVLLIWAVAIAWDIRLKMWREQQMVLTERNPYAKEKMSAKELVIYQLLWMPMLEKLGKDDPKIREAVTTFKQWLEHLPNDDPILARDLKEIYDYINRK
jgi:hypothetical protein